eukprot:SAG31_NODE_3537_length_4145_cov_3.205141_1_plen_146_part_00
MSWSWVRAGNSVIPSLRSISRVARLVHSSAPSRATTLLSSPLSDAASEHTEGVRLGGRRLLVRLPELRVDEARRADAAEPWRLGAYTPRPIVPFMVLVKIYFKSTRPAEVPALADSTQTAGRPALAHPISPHVAYRARAPADRIA